MILDSFDVRVRPGRTFQFVDRGAIDSDVERQAVELAIIEQLQSAQQDAMCLALGIAELETIPNFGFGVYENGNRIGIYLMASCDYLSGPWDDLVGWNETSDDPVTVNGRHMPGFSGLSAVDEQDLSAEATYHFLANRLSTVGGHEIEFAKVSWAIFEDRTDPKSLRDIGIHNKIINDPRIKATMVPDVDNPILTRVDVELL